MRNQINKASKQFKGTDCNIIFIADWLVPHIRESEIRSALFGGLKIRGDFIPDQGMVVNLRGIRDKKKAELRISTDTRISGICVFDFRKFPLHGELKAFYHNPYASKKIPQTIFEDYNQVTFDPDEIKRIQE